MPRPNQVKTVPNARNFPKLVKGGGAFRILDTPAFGEVLIRKALIRGHYSVYTAPFTINERHASGPAVYIANLLLTPKEEDEDNDWAESF